MSKDLRTAPVLDALLVGVALLIGILVMCSLIFVHVLSIDRKLDRHAPLCQGAVSSAGPASGPGAKSSGVTYFPKGCKR